MRGLRRWIRCIRSRGGVWGDCVCVFVFVCVFVHRDEGCFTWRSGGVKRAL